MPRKLAPLSSRRAIQSAQREQNALQLRKAGVQYEEIALQLGYSNRSAAWKAVQRAIRRIPREEAKAVRSLEENRLDDMILSMWPAVRQGSVRAAEVVLKIMERRAQLLGLDAPRVVHVDIEHQIRSWATENGLDPEEAVREAQAILGGTPG